MIVYLMVSLICAALLAAGLLRSAPTPSNEPKIGVLLTMSFVLFFALLWPIWVGMLIRDALLRAFARWRLRP